MYSGLVRQAGLLGFVLLAACGGGSGESNEPLLPESFELRLEAFEPAHDVAVLVNGETVWLPAEQGRKFTVDPGGSVELSIEQPSPLISCGFAPRHKQTIVVEHSDVSNQIIDCMTVTFLAGGSLSYQDGEQRTYISDGTVEGTSLYKENRILHPWAWYGSNLILIRPGEPVYWWSDGPGKKPVLFPTDLSGAVDFEIGTRELFALYVDETTGQARVETSWSPDSSTTLFANLSPLPASFRYTGLKITPENLVITSRSSDSELPEYQLHIYPKESPASWHGPYPIPESVYVSSRLFKNQLVGIGGDADGAAEWKLVLFDIQTGTVVERDLPRSNIQSARIERQGPDDWVVEIQYSSGEGEELCVSYHRLADGLWETGSDLCQSHSGVKTAYRSLVGDSLYMVASAESGEWVPADASMVVLENLFDPGSDITLIPGEAFEGRIVDHSWTETGGYFYTIERLAEGCPLAPWRCVYRGRLYSFKRGVSGEATLLMDGFYEETLFGSVVFLSEHNLPGNLTLFLSFTPETGSEVWRSDGTKEGTFFLKDTNPGPESSASAMMSPAFMRWRN